MRRTRQGWRLEQILRILFLRRPELSMHMPPHNEAFSLLLPPTPQLAEFCKPEVINRMIQFCYKQEDTILVTSKSLNLGVNLVFRSCTLKGLGNSLSKHGLDMNAWLLFRGGVPSWPLTGKSLPTSPWTSLLSGNLRPDLHCCHYTVENHHQHPSG